MNNQPLLREFYTANRLELPPHRIFYTEWGDPDNNKVIFCVHGLARNCRDFDYIAQVLSKDYRVICPDMAGRGKSEWLDNKILYNYRTYMLDIVDLTKHLGVEKVDWIGTSMGGLIGIFTVIFNRGLIKRIVLNDIGPFIPKESLQRIAKYVGVVPRFVNLEQAERHIRKILAPFGIVNEADWRYITLHSVTETENGDFTLVYDPGIANAFGSQAIDLIMDVDLWNEWNLFDVEQILLLRGKDSDILLEETAKKMQKSKNNVTLVEFENIGHAPSLMNSNEINAIKQWLS